MNPSPSQNGSEPHSGERGAKLEGISRRFFIRVGSGGVAFSWVPPVLAESRSSHSSCIQIFLWGGPGAQETWDLKPEAPQETRGAFLPIETSVPGTRFCEHLPEMAKRAHRYTIIRSLTHEGVNHGTSSYHMLTGHVHPSPGTLRHPTPDDMPNIGANAARFLSHPAHLPAHVHLPAVINDGDALPVPGQDSGILGEAHAPFRVLGNLTDPKFRVPSLSLAEEVSQDRFERRKSLTQAIEGLRERKEPLIQQVEIQRERAFSLLSSKETQDAFDLSKEPERLRERYGKHHFAQALLLARRLVEAGVPFVTVYWDSPRNTDDQSWDTHTDQHRRMREHLLPAFDRSMSVFVDELHERGLIDTTLVTWYGEFGRTPKINGSGGRDHWGFCQSVGILGSGIVPGMIWGSSTRDGGYAASDPVRPDDLAATIYHCLGIDHHQHMHDRQNRPIPLSYGEPVHRILSKG